jgi:hypothetical protein
MISATWFLLWWQTIQRKSTLLTLSTSCSSSTERVASVSLIHQCRPNTAPSYLQPAGLPQNPVHKSSSNPNQESPKQAPDHHAFRRPKQSKISYLAHWLLGLREGSGAEISVPVYLWTQEAGDRWCWSRGRGKKRKKPNRAEWFDHLLHKFSCRHGDRLEEHHHQCGNAWAWPNPGILQSQVVQFQYRKLHSWVACKCHWLPVSRDCHHQNICHF